MATEIITEQVCVVIPVFGRDDVFNTVPFLMSQSYANNLEIVIVDNGNDNERAARLAGLSSVRVSVVRLPENRGGSGGYNAGMRYAIEKYKESALIWLLDDDAEPNSETLPGLISAYYELQGLGHAKVASVGSAIVRKKAPDVITECGAFMFEHSDGGKMNLKGASLSENRNKEFPVEYCSGCSCLVTRKALEEVGLWEEVFIYFDDVEWGVRAKRRFGYENFGTTRSVVIHPEVTPKKNGGWANYFSFRNGLWICAMYEPAIYLQTMKHYRWTGIKDFMIGRMNDVASCRHMALVDHRNGVRKTRTEVVCALERIRVRRRFWPQFWLMKIVRLLLGKVV